MWLKAKDVEGNNYILNLTNAFDVKIGKDYISDDGTYKYKVKVYVWFGTTEEDADAYFVIATGLNRETANKLVDAIFEALKRGDVTFEVENFLGKTRKEKYMRGEESEYLQRKTHS